MNTPNSKSISIKLDKRRTRDILVTFSIYGTKRNELTFNREYLSKMTNLLWMLFAMEIYGGTSNIVYLNKGIKKKLALSKYQCKD